ncbi:MAG: molybdopterin-dependent oxidoreductase [Microbacteriaceae bacterium]
MTLNTASKPAVKAPRTLLWAAASGVAAAATTLAVAEFLALVLAPASSPLFAVGSLVIDLAPAWLKDVVIALFGVDDKAVLIVCLGILVTVLAVASGVLQYLRPPLGLIILVLISGVALLAVLTRAEATALWAIPTTAGMLAGAVVLHVSAVRLRRWSKTQNPGELTATLNEGVARRSFLNLVIGVGAASVVVGFSSRVMNAGLTAVNAVRKAITLPRAASVLDTVPAGASLDIEGISPIISANEGFYRIDTALQVPTVDAESWRLRITGMVEQEIEISFEELLALPLVETHVTLMCVSNDVGAGLVGNAKWLGYPIRELLAKAKPLTGADMVLSRSVDGWTASTPLEVLQESSRNSILAVGMNGEPLPVEHGFPVRMVVPGLYGYVSATKWVVELKVTRFADETAYWTDRGWSATGPVKTSSRIDVPRTGRDVPEGLVAVAGVAWAQHTGIDGVEVRVDGGPWLPAILADAISADTWRQWRFEWDAKSGNHVIEARAIDSGGGIQSGTPRPVVPDGAEGWHTISVTVR